jgi:hypothetical protein
LNAAPEWSGTLSATATGSKPPHPVFAALAYAVLTVGALWLGFRLLPTNETVEREPAGQIVVLTTGRDVDASITTDLIDADSRPGPHPQTELSLSAPSSQEVEWAVQFIEDAQCNLDEEGEWGYEGGTIHRLNGRQIVLGKAVIGPEPTHVFRISCNTLAEYFRTSGSLTVGSVPGYGTSGSALSTGEGVTDDIHKRFKSPSSLDVKLDVYLNHFNEFSRVDVVSPPSTFLGPSGFGSFRWEAEGGLPTVRIRYTNLIEERNERDRILIAGLVLGIAGGAFLRVIEAIGRAVNESSIIWARNLRRQPRRSGTATTTDWAASERAILRTTVRRRRGRRR